MNSSSQDLAIGTAVRLFSSYGPCLSSAVVKANRVTYTLQSYGKVDKSLVHAEPCPRCTDHANTSYPDGYLD